MKKKLRLQSITAKLSEQPKKSLNENITTNPLFGQLEEQQNELVQGISDLETNPSIVTEVEMLLRFLRKFCENINLYLALSIFRSRIPFHLILNPIIPFKSR